MTDVRESPQFSLLPAHETDVTGVFDILDELDAWLKTKLSVPFDWIESGRDVRFDQTFRKEAARAVGRNSFDKFVDYHAYHWERQTNMDF